MERLTFEGNFCDIARCREMPCPYNNRCTQREVWERLKAYEDSGVSPKALAQALEMENLLADEYYSMNRMLELLKADKEGRVVVLPCKVGRRVYVPDFEVQTVANVRVQGISITPTGRVVLHFGGYPAESAWGDRCGIDWFLTYEGADAALRRENG